MSRSRDYDMLYRNRVCKFREECIYICDIQGFERIVEDSFIFKEISFLNLKETALPTVYLFEPPFAWEKLGEEEKCMTQWLEKTHHGIAWNSGDISYDRLERILEIGTQGVEKLYVKGDEKVQWLKNFLPDILISNVEDLGCPSLEEINNHNQYMCFNHDLCIRRKPMCAVMNVLSIRTWLLHHLNGRFGKDEVDYKSNNYVCSCLYWK